MKKYKPRSLSGAAKKITNLESQIEELNRILKLWKVERIVLAKLAAKGPTFFNPLEAMAAEKIRDTILDQLGMRPDGSFKDLVEKSVIVPMTSQALKERTKNEYQ